MIYLILHSACNLYSLNRNEAVKVPALMILSNLSSAKEAKELLQEEALSVLVGFLGKSVRNELPKEGRLWSLHRRTIVISTLERMITSDEQVVATLLKLELLTLLSKTLGAQNATQEEVRSALTCLWTLSTDVKALQQISRDENLLRGEFEN